MVTASLAHLVVRGGLTLAPTEGGGMVSTGDSSLTGESAVIWGSSSPRCLAVVSVAVVSADLLMPINSGY